GAPVTLPDDDARAGDARLPSVWPRPQSMTASGTAVPVGDDVVLVVPRVEHDSDHDPYALKALRDLLHDTGARRI
ncbi:hyaluronoglucosaminidase superfamily protein, partial [Streptomyces sp. SID10116]|nr:hyaluronoglucosaminidase superfamily protein [Streptomyces sp. SID10116]